LPRWYLHSRLTQNHEICSQNNDIK